MRELGVRHQVTGTDLRKTIETLPILLGGGIRRNGGREQLGKNDVCIVILIGRDDKRSTQQSR